MLKRMRKRIKAVKVNLSITEMVREDIHSLITLNDCFINDLAADWYFLSLHFNNNCLSEADEYANELIDCGIVLKRYLQTWAFTFLEPMNVCVDTDTFFDIWLDADGDIQVSELYSDEEY